MAHLKPKFKDGENVLCYKGKFIYEAKVIKSVISKDEQIKYYIHYVGHNKRIDEMVSQYRLLKKTNRNIQKQRDLANLANRSKNKRNPIATEKSNENKIKFSAELIAWLLEDSNALIMERKLIIIPAKQNVKKIIDDFIETKKTSESITHEEEMVFVEVTSGLLAYFNDMLLHSPKALLRKVERQQYDEVLKEYPNTPMANVYGSFHLLRFIQCLKLSNFSLNTKSTKTLRSILQEILNYMEENSSKLFSKEDFVDRQIVSID